VSNKSNKEQREYRERKEHKNYGKWGYLIPLFAIALVGFFFHSYRVNHPENRNVYLNNVNEVNGVITGNSNTHLLDQMGLEEAFLRRVINGDTLLLTNGDIVRLIGVDSPSTNEPGGLESACFVNSIIENGQTIWLESAGRDKDEFDRLRRYVWLEIPTNISDLEQRREFTLNEILLNNGFAVEFEASN